MLQYRITRGSYCEEPYPPHIMQHQMPLSRLLTDVKQKLMNKQLAIIRGSRIDSSAENQTLNENFKRFTLQFKFNTFNTDREIIHCT